MADNPTLLGARELVAGNTAHYPNETVEYRAARNELLAEEIELRRHVERVAARRRGLPLGGEVPRDYEFVGESGPIRLSDLFLEKFPGTLAGTTGGTTAGTFSGPSSSRVSGTESQKHTLMVYSMMYGAERKAPCPMCTSFLSSWNGTAVNLRERVAMVVTARSPIERLVEYKKQRGFANLRFVSDMLGEYTRAYVNANDADVPGFGVFTRRDGRIFHWYSGELSGAMADPGQDPRGAPDMDPLWLMLDLTPEGRGTDWYPKLQYDHK
jgi:predicted dithiol-disulfide oxidoreductase (DUF899 family)